MSTRTRAATRQQADQVAALVREAFPRDDGPTVAVSWDWLGLGSTTALVWEEGPTDWAVAFCGTEQARQMPANVWGEPVTYWALGVYREVSA